MFIDFYEKANISKNENDLVDFFDCRGMFALLFNKLEKRNYLYSWGSNSFHDLARQIVGENQKIPIKINIGAA